MITIPSALVSLLLFRVCRRRTVILAHEYFVRESELIWETIKVGLPDLAAVCRDELKRLGYQT
jgi:uncharacterized protein with HEPN domain